METAAKEVKSMTHVLGEAFASIMVSGGLVLVVVSLYVISELQGIAGEFPQTIVLITACAGFIGMFAFLSGGAVFGAFSHLKRIEERLDALAEASR